MRASGRQVYDMVAKRPQLKHVVLMCPAVNEIDMSALESLEAINERLKALGVTFHLSEVKGPVMDRLRRSLHLTGKVFLSQHQAIASLPRTFTNRSQPPNQPRSFPTIGQPPISRPTPPTGPSSPTSSSPQRQADRSVDRHRGRAHEAWIDDVNDTQTPR
jgi:hypothetical protein